MPEGQEGDEVERRKGKEGQKGMFFLKGREKKEIENVTKKQKRPGSQ